jgi:hypothetical protein
MFEKLNKPELAVLSVAVALGASACGSSKPAEAVKSASNPQGSGLVYEVTYFPDGSRRLKPSGDNSFDLSPIRQWCDGGNLEQQTEASSNGSHSYGEASPTSMSPNDSKCEDGKLTPSDFIKSTSAIEVSTP